MKASIEDVARQAGVSTATVSRAFSRPDMVSCQNARQGDGGRPTTRLLGIPHGRHPQIGPLPPRGAAGGQQQARLVHLAHHRRPQRSAAIGRLRSGHPTDRRRGRARGVLRRTAGARQRGRGHRLVVRHHPGPKSGDSTPRGSRSSASTRPRRGSPPPWASTTRPASG